MTSPQTNWRIQSAGAAEIPQIQAWLPQAFLGVPRASFFSAIDESTNALAGAASLRMLPDQSRGAEARFLLFVRPEFRRRRVGTHLLQTLTEIARSNKAARFLAGRSLESTDEQVEFFHHMSMQVHSRRILYEMMVERSYSTLHPIFSQLQERGDIPAHARLVRIDEVPTKALAEFATRYLGGLVDSVMEKITNPTEGFCRDL